MSVNGAILLGGVPGGAPLQGELLWEKEGVTEQGEQHVSVDWGKGRLPLSLCVNTQKNFLKNNPKNY